MNTQTHQPIQYRFVFRAGDVKVRRTCEKKGDCAHDENAHHGHATNRIEMGGALGRERRPPVVFCSMI